MKEEPREMFPIDTRSIREFLRGKLSKYLETLTTEEAYNYAEDLREASYSLKAAKNMGFGQSIDPDVRKFVYGVRGEEKFPQLFSRFKYLHSLGHNLEDIYEAMKKRMSKESSEFPEHIRKIGETGVEDAYEMAQEKLRTLH